MEPLTVLYFDLLGMKAAILEDLEVATKQLLDLSLLLPAITRGGSWHYGFHLSDSTFLVHTDKERAAAEAIRIWQRLLWCEESELGLDPLCYGMDAWYIDQMSRGLLQLPRGCLATGELKLVPRIRWRAGVGFERTEREITLNWDRIGKPDSVKIEFREQVAELEIEKSTDGAGRIHMNVFVRKMSENDELLGIVPLDPDGGLDQLHVAEIGNLTGRAVLDAVVNAESRGLKGPRLLVTGDPFGPPELRQYFRKVADLPLYELLWTADFGNLESTIRHLRVAFQHWERSRNLGHGARVQYDALLCLALAGLSAVVRNSAQLDTFRTSVLDHIVGSTLEKFDERNVIVAAVAYHAKALGIDPASILPATLLNKLPSADHELAKLANLALAPQLNAQ